MNRVKMINTIIKDYQKELIKSHENARLNCSLYSIESEVSSFLEQLQFHYSEDQLKELYELVK